MHALNPSRLWTRLRWTLGLVALLVLGASCTTPPEPALPEGLSPALTDGPLAPGDELTLTVFQEPSCSGTFVLDGEGRMKHPLLGMVLLAGRTLDEAEELIKTRLAADYLVQPRLTLEKADTQKARIVLFGEVRQPGVYPLEAGRTQTLLQAIATAGGFTELASPDRARIVRRTKDGTTTLRVRVSDLLEGRGDASDVQLAPNDVIVIPEIIF